MSPSVVVNDCNSKSPIQLTPSMLPPCDDVVFWDSSFFTRPGAPPILPSPPEILAAAERLKPNTWLKRTIWYPDLGLVVKYGLEVDPREGQCLWAIRRFLGDAIPVPEVYGWSTYDQYGFIYMELIQGMTLEERWDSLGEEERLGVCDELHRMVKSLRRLQQDPEDQFVGHIGRQPLLDIIFVDHRKGPVGPLPSVQSFHDKFATLHYRDHYVRTSPDPYRIMLPDNAPIVFTHGDLHPRNIILSASGAGPVRVLAIVDWQQSGWLPAYWEACKAFWTTWGTPSGTIWAEKYLPRILEQMSVAEHTGWEWFVLSNGM
ncbi:hypothetical protein Hypma_016123 [Hypsizygus marmoreus]|uniref:Aminoglycoside phosphotransferase domain-containing protein n=1 Tax=Hypsizygus marmoreus TaxID=39966 RepID=A0A369K5S9_HYPMA|nr:hypothetical protein Hypma_016123 [Hypsizygus marmoreus]